MKRSLLSTIKSAYKNIDDVVIAIKSATMSACAGIDRYLREKLNINIGTDISEEQFEKFQILFPNLANLNLEQINRLLLLFGNIRNVNAHLYSNKPLFLDSDLKDCLVSKCKPTYLITIGKELTIYGMYYLILHLEQGYQCWGFMTSLFSRHYFTEITSGSFQTQFISKELKDVALKSCGIGKPFYHFDNSEESKVDVLGLNNLCYQNLTLIFFDLEKTSNWSKATISTKRPPSLSHILSSKTVLAEQPVLLNRILQLRNDWFHGKCLYDYILVNGKDVLFTLSFLNSVLLDLKNSIKNVDSFQDVIADIDHFGRMLIKYYSLRLVEVSYKILDSRLLTEDKIESRLADADVAFERLVSGNEDYYNSALKLLDGEEMNWDIIKNKFLDFRPRKTKANTLYIMKIHSEIGFDIGNFHTNKKDICLVEVDLPEIFQNTINGRFLKDYAEIDFHKHSNLFVVCNLK